MADLTKSSFGRYYDLKRSIPDLDSLPYSMRMLMENVLRQGGVADVTSLLKPSAELPFIPSRLVMQDFTGVPAIVDLAALREKAKDPASFNPRIQTDLVVDHSVQVDFFGTTYAYQLNTELEMERNRERYQLLKWAQNSFKRLRVVPPGRGIVHQVNLEYLASVVINDGGSLYPDSVLGTDSHTTMIGGLGILGWGIGGIEAEALMLGKPYYLPLPQVVGVRLSGNLSSGATATDLVLTVTELLRKRGVVGKFVEFFGPGLKGLRVEDRATVSNMTPEYGATIGFFPPDERTLAYLKMTNRYQGYIESYLKGNGLFYSDDEAEGIRYDELLDIDLKQIEPSIAGPKNPDSRVGLRDVRASVQGYIKTREGELRDGVVAIAAITSCTNTSNPSVVIGAGLLARAAVQLGLRTKPWVKTSLAPGSPVVEEYLRRLNLLPYLEALGFQIVGFGCTTCIGNSGPLPDRVAREISSRGLWSVAVLSGNRNFEGRINPMVKASYLMSPPLVVAYALAGYIDTDMKNDPIGTDPNGREVYLKDIWPSEYAIEEGVRAIDQAMFRERYSDIFKGKEEWEGLDAGHGLLYGWNPSSTYIKRPPFVEMKWEGGDIRGARALLVLGDKITTDHISPAGGISPSSEAGKFLLSLGVEQKDFNSYGSRRGNHEVMLRGGFSNTRLRNFLLEEGVEGGNTIYLPAGEVTSVYRAAMKYQERGTPLIILAGKEYGSGSSRDWAAKVTRLLGVRAVIAESYERIHRNNLIDMGVLPLQADQGWRELGLSGRETFDIDGIADLTVGKEISVSAAGDGQRRDFKARARIDSETELQTFRKGGIFEEMMAEIG